MKNPTEDQIRRRAYEVYLRDGKPGQDVQNWLQAERELKELPEGIIEDDENRLPDEVDVIKESPNRKKRTLNAGRNQEFAVRHER